MINLSIEHKQYRKYTESPTSIVSGQAFYNNKFYKNGDLADLVSAWENPEDFYTALNQLNGFYALIRHQNNELFAAVDRVRSIPLFYGQKGNNFFLSDSAEWVRQKLGNEELDQLAKEEFLLTGYVTGSDTLFPDVKQLQAGEAIIVKDTEQGLSVKPVRYYRFIHEYEQDKRMEELMEEHDQVLLQVFARLIEVADGRTIVVPLSGGYDSRLIVLMLKRLGYNNVIAFSYGRPGNKESEVSRKVAELLGVRWEFVPYSNEDWYKWFNSEERKKYWEFASGLCSLGHMQDWPAVWQLRKNKAIPDDSIFVPGHTGDFISGGHIPIEFGTIKTVTTERLIDSILKKHYVLHNKSELATNEKRLLRNKIINLCEANESLTSINAASAFEKWEWQERQSKFIVNSVRVYDYWEYSWYLPLWDYEYMNFWSTVPLKYRVNQAMYKPFVDNLLYTSTGCVLPRDDLNPSLTQRVKRVLTSDINYSLKDLLKRILLSNQKVRAKEYNNHPLAVWGRYASNEESFLNLTRDQKYMILNYVNCVFYLSELMDKTKIGNRESR